MVWHAARTNTTRANAIVRGTDARVTRLGWSGYGHDNTTREHNLCRPHITARAYAGGLRHRGGRCHTMPAEVLATTTGTAR